ncbi:FGGY-family carbohydrate kinase [Lichenihabitans psoromatis]|uniref:FGGY-family carbohydrate kinase n=1 Tax=Lichenihabitans psoromatis TaxID=2528642 RepID=UPI0010382EC5|nr:FGGY-family carbohydrate kinase [Lichenihabitans psoromatis]
MSVVIGVDGGTEGLRAGVYNRAGRCLGAASQNYDTQFSAGARAEQNPEEWWSALGIAVRKAMTAAGVSPDAVDAIALDTTSCTVVALDRDGRPVRPAILWMDVRAGAEAAAVLATGDEALRVNGAEQGPVSAEWMIPKALWISRHEPDVFAQAATICEYQDFMTLRLTGRRVGSLTNVSLRWHYSSERKGGWPYGLLKALDLEILADKWPSDILPPGDVIGPLTTAAAAHLGLSERTQVIQGGVDAVIGMIGLGVAAPGQLALITGSSHLQFGVVADGAISKPGLWGAYPDLPIPGRYMLEGGQTSTGSIVNWLRRLGGSSFDLATLNEEAAALRPGCDGLLVLDHFQGNRTPYTDPHSRGAFVGLTLAHGMPHLFRAAIEGICMGTRSILDRMAEAGFDGREIVIGGGAAKSDLWLQIHADTAGLPVVVPDAADAPLVGAAILAFTGIGVFASISEGIAAMVRPGRRIEPRPAERALYDDIYLRYVELYPALRPFRSTASA